jgi:hypothetical protein
MADGDGGIIIFVYTGGEQVVPDDVTHVSIHKSVKIIPRRAFYFRRNLMSVETHDELEKIEEEAFTACILRGIKLPGVMEIEYRAFFNCAALTDVEFGNKLETIEGSAFSGYISLQNIKIPTVRTINLGAFGFCKQLVETIGHHAFIRCRRLQRIAIPLKDNMFPLHYQQRRCTQFDECENLTTVDLVGGIHKTISSLLLESWRDEINQEIDRINQDLPNTPANEKTDAIRQWITSVINRMEHYKSQHNQWQLVEEVVYA